MVRQGRKNRTESDERSQTIIGIALILAAFVIASGGVFFYFKAKSEQVEIDSITHCPLSGPVTLTVVLVDQTDTFNARQQEFIRNQLIDVQEDIPKRGALYIYGFGSDRTAILKPALRVCNPGRGADTDPLTGSARRVETAWKSAFQHPVQAIMEQAIAPSGAESSPIMEAIQSVSIDALQQRTSADQPRQLIIVSDLLHFTPEYSQYSGSAEFKALRESGYYARVKTNLDGVDVRVLYVRRSSGHDRQGAAHVKFWSEYFIDQGARKQRFTRVEG